MNGYVCADYTANQGVSPYLCIGIFNGILGFDAQDQCCFCGGGDLSWADQIKPVDSNGDAIASCVYGAADCIYSYDFNNNGGDYDTPTDVVQMRWKVEDTRSAQSEGSLNLEFSRTILW